MAEAVEWRKLGKAIEQEGRELKLPPSRRTDPLRPYREAAYDLATEAVAEARDRRAGGESVTAEAVLAEHMPWEGRGWGRSLNAGSIRDLLDSMARNAVTGDQIAAVFLCFDAARDLAHVPWATGAAGEILLERADGRRPEPPLPADWKTRVEHAITPGRGPQKSSATYWAYAMLEASGRHVRPPEKDEHHTEGPEAGPVAGLG